MINWLALAQFYNQCGVYFFFLELFFFIAYAIYFTRIIQQLNHVITREMKIILYSFIIA